MFLLPLLSPLITLSFRPLAGCGLFRICARGARVMTAFPSPCGVWVVSWAIAMRSGCSGSFRPLAGYGLFPLISCLYVIVRVFPSPCGVWVVSQIRSKYGAEVRFRPLAGYGLFRQSCTFFLVQQEKELSTLLFYCIILADVYQ